MKARNWLMVLSGMLLLAAAVVPANGEGAEASAITWKKTQLDKAFRSEGVAVADVNKDGKADVLVGDVWYEAPDWKAHPIRPAKDDYREGDKNVYSQCMACFADDLNGDGWPDQIVIGFPGKPCHWYENPQGKEGFWKEHEIWKSACNETTLYVDLFGDGKKKIIMAIQPEGQMCWFAPGADPTALWTPHPISEKSTKEKKVPGTQPFSHGLGAGDINGDGRLDVLCTAGWWEQPVKDDGQPWKFHPVKLGELCANMFAYDVDGDGKADVISSSAHNYGIWWHQQKPGKASEPAFLTQDLFKNLFSQSHALQCEDINGDGLKDLITGKRWWAHGPKGDVAANDPAVLYWFEAKRGRDGIIQFIPHLIDSESGIGTQFTVADINGDGLPDIAISNKRGVFIIEQVRAGK